MPDRLKMPPASDFGFYQRRKHDKWRAVAPPEPPLEAPVADSHAHIHLLPDPGWELARCAANGVDFVCMITDPSEDGPRPAVRLLDWQTDAENPRLAADREAAAFAQADAARGARPGAPGTWVGEGGRGFACPTVCMAAGVHPHNARLYDDAVERALLASLDDPRVAAVGEIGLDFHYDISPRDDQRRVFRRQIAIALEADLPIALHLRGGEGGEKAAPGKSDMTGEGVEGASGNIDAAAAADAHAGEGVSDAVPRAANGLADGDAHAEAFEILREAAALGPRTLLHCCTLGPEELRPWIDAGCYIAYGGALTFKNAQAVREGARLVPADRLLLETDSPYMTPEPMRGATCTPAHAIFTAAALAEARGVPAGDNRRAFLQQLHDNTLAFYRVEGQGA